MLVECFKIKYATVAAKFAIEYSLISQSNYNETGLMIVTF